MNYRVPLAKPHITQEDIKAVTDVLSTPFLSLGPVVEKFETKFAEYVGVDYAVSANSGTSALHLIVRGLGIGDGDEVITTPFSFVASANCLLFERAKPIFVDIDPTTLAIDPERIEEKISEKTRAILAVDVFGHPAEWRRLKDISERYGLKLIEDSAEALGSEYQGRKAGSLGDVGVFGFYPNKQITTGEGGMIVSDDGALTAVCRSMGNQGRGHDSEWLGHERLGYNYRLSDLNCALGLTQLKRVDEMRDLRIQLARMYTERLHDLAHVLVPSAAPNVTVNWFVYVVRLSDEYSLEDRRRILLGLRERGIGCSDYFKPIHLQPFYRALFGYQEGDFPITEAVASRTIALPFYNELTETEIEYVVSQLRELL